MFKAAGSRNRYKYPALALLLVVAVLAGPMPRAGAVDGIVDYPAKYSACFGPAAASAGFTDMVGSFAEEAANCLAHYGITFGTEPGRFSSGDVIPRWQMALFLQRATAPAGLVVPKPTDQGFTDIDALDSHLRDGINQIAELGIMPGRTETTYGPSEPVTRQEMAILLARFLAAAPTGPGGTPIRDIRPDDGNFTDINRVPFVINQAIRRLFEMGIAQGTAADTFSPDNWVTRGQMAVFITRMLAHTNARPAGLTAQISDDLVFRGSTAEIAISYRDDFNRPYALRTLDLFIVEHPEEAFDDNGKCTDKVLPGLGADECVIDTSDTTTDASGNLLADVEVEDSEKLRVWVWTGSVNDTFDEDTTTFVTVDLVTRGTPTALLVSDDLPPSATKVPFGRPVTFIFQLVDEERKPVPWEGVEFVVEVRESRDNGNRVERTTLNKKTGPEGSAQATFINVDPSPELGDLAFLDLDVEVGPRLGLLDETAVGIVEDDGAVVDSSLRWSDERPEPTTLKVSVAREYIVASSAGNGAAATVLATLTDQYGAPVSGEQVAFSSNDSAGAPNGIRRTTHLDGVAELNYQRDSDRSYTERVTGSFRRLSHTARQFWVTRLLSSAGGSGTVRLIDTDSDEVVVVTSSAVHLVEYDANDQFTVGGKAVGYSDFEAALSIRDTLSFQVTDGRPGTVNSYTLTNR